MVAKYHEKIRHCRTDYLQKETTKIVKAYGFIAVEDLKVKNMMANPNNKKILKANRRKTVRAATKEPGQKVIFLFENGRVQTVKPTMTVTSMRVKTF